MDISFYFPLATSLSNRTELKLFISSIFKKEKVKASSLTVVFCSNAYLLQINKTFLQHDYFTDIITFNLSEPGSRGIEGEIYISTETVRSNAKLFGTSIKNELHRVVFHGVLHLCGYVDNTKKQKLLMTKKEDHYLNLYFKLK